MESLIVVVVFLILVVLTIALGVRIVPQGSKHVVQRLGKYLKTLPPGLNIVIPYIDSVAYKVTTKDIVLDIPSQEVITRDNAVIIANAVAYINIVSPEKAVYGVEDYTIAIQNLVQTSLRPVLRHDVPVGDEAFGILHLAELVPHLSKPKEGKN